MKIPNLIAAAMFIAFTAEQYAAIPTFVETGQTGMMDQLPAPSAVPEYVSKPVPETLPPKPRDSLGPPSHRKLETYTLTRAMNPTWTGTMNTNHIGGDLADMSSITIGGKTRALGAAASPSPEMSETTVTERTSDVNPTRESSSGADTGPPTFSSGSTSVAAGSAMIMTAIIVTYFL
uniref:Uncharacterized protein n=1 Tax=Peronospora matthiolae TaxID=2874970 RepID=A0AAV1VE48_9STRA